MRRVLKYDLICTGAMSCVAAGVVMNILYLQALQSAGPSVLVLIPVATGLAAPFLTLTVRMMAGARRSRFMEAMGAGSLLYLIGSSQLSLSLPSLLQSRSGL
jgi:hypothetical protein